MEKLKTSSEATQTNNILHVTIGDKASLYAAYMPFLRNGGLFVETSETHNLGDEVCIQLNLFADPEKIPIFGKVVWITPKHTHPNQALGLGIAFNEKDGPLLRHKIESCLTDFAPKAPICW